MSLSQDPDHGRPPKQINAILGLFDKPPHRDWLVWWTVGLIVIAGLAIGFPSEESVRSTSLPRWLDALLAAIVFGVLFGFFPAYLRLLLRRLRFRRSKKVGRGDRQGGVVSPTVMPTEKPESSAVPPPQTGEPAPSRPAERSDTPPPARAPESGMVLPTVALPEEPARAGQCVAKPARGSSVAPKAAGRPSTTPVAIEVLRLSMVRDSAVLSLARRDMPYPVARAVRAVQQAPDAKETYESILRAAEALSTVLGITAVLWARRHDVATPELRALQTAFRRSVSWGVWTDAARSVQQSMAGHPQAIPGMAEALRSGKSGTRLISDLQDLATERNRWAHGRGPRNQLDAAQRLHEVFPLFEGALQNARFLSEVPWILTKNSKLRRRQHDFQIEAAKGMGDHPDFDVMTFTSSVPLAEDTFYLLTPDGPLDMTPLVVLRPCPTCHQHEVAYAEGVDERKGVALKTFDRGHVVFDTGLLEEIRHLIEDEGTSRETDTA